MFEISFRLEKMGIDIDIEVAVNSNVPLRRWMVNWTLSFLT